ncbi:MAG: PKD domain-containing protein, partial [Saprospiraceae bacterium]
MNTKQLLSLLRSTFFLTLFNLLLATQFSYLVAQCADDDGVILVTNTNDEGEGSLRAAIDCANATAGPNQIEFAIPDDAIQRIFVGSTSGEPLPSINDANTIIDATTQVGFGQTDNFPRIVLDGSQTTWDGPYNGLFILADNCEIYGLEMTDFPDDAIDVYDSDNVIIGASGKGNMIYNNGVQQDVFPGFTGSWEGCSIVLRTGSNNCKVQGNIIGTDRNQRAGIGSEFCGIINRSGADNNLIGGDKPGEANLIAYNPIGIRVDNSTGVRIQQNIMYCNDTVAIQLRRNANFEKAAPVIVRATVEGISGTALPDDVIEVFLADRNCQNTPCQGRELLGVTTADANGNWSLQANAEDITTLEGETITATATDRDNNTSSFAGCRGIVNTADCVDAQGFIYVTNADDEGQGSLRAAIDCANTSPGPNIIRFDIAGSGPHRIYIGETSDEKLPALTDPGTTIDGASQADYGLNNNFQPQIILDGSRKVWRSAANAIWVRADETEIYALEIVNFPDDGIDLTRANFCQIGDVNLGNVIYNVGSEQDFFPETSGGPWEGCGIVMKLGSNNNVIQGNYLGTNYRQTIRGGIEYLGVLVRDGGDNNVIGGRQTGQGNVIANNAGGVLVRSNSFDTRIQGNSFYCNDTIAIALSGNANNGHPAPVVSQATVETISGTAAANDIVEIYINDNTGCQDAICQGRFLLGRVSANGSGSWSLNEPFRDVLEEGDIVTAVSTSFTGNTSPFSACREVGEQPACTLSATAIGVRNATCGEDNGGFRISPQGGDFPYYFDTGNGRDLNNSFENLSAGTYSVTVTDRNDCLAVVSLTLTESGIPVPFVADIQDASCDSPTGGFTVAVQGGAVPIRFDAGFGQQNSGEFQNLTAGNYIITITDANDCQATQAVAIDGVEPPTAAITEQTDATCEAGEVEASFRVSAANGTPPYTYDIGDGVVDNNFFGGLSSGTYAVTVTDANGCTVEVSTSVVASSPPDADFSGINDASCGGDDGGFSLFVRNNTGTPPYTFATGDLSNTTGNFTNLAPSTYTVTITDANGCQDIEGITIGTAAPPVGTISNIQSATCDNNNAGFTVNVDGGTSPFTYNLGDGELTNNTFSNLSAGTYAVTITDANGCQDIQGVSLDEAAAPLLTIVSSSPASCGGDDGAFRINANNGTPPYTFDIGNGAQDNGSFSDLGAGIYATKVIDGNGCESNINVQIAGGAPPSVNIASTSEAACDQATGSFTLNINGGESPYVINYGSGNINGTTANNLAAGNYEVTVADANNCTVTQAVTISNSESPTATVANTTAAACEQNNGSFTLNINGGESPYSLNYGNGNIAGNTANNLAADDYNVTIADANGCTTTQAISIAGSTGPSVAIDNLQPATCGSTDGGFTATATEGTAPYTFNIGQGAVDNGTFANLASDNYTVTVTDANGCETTQSVSVDGETTLTTGTSSVKPPACGESNGSFKIEVSNGQAPFQYNIGSGNVSDPNFENLGSGLYQVTITDAGNCSAVEEISFENSGIAPTARFTFIRDDLTITITNNSTAATFNSWTFGDGSEAETYSPSHTYPGDGQYTICLNVANECGSDFVCSELNIGGVVDAKANITGTIMQENGQFVNLVEVDATNLLPMTTGNNGEYFFFFFRANNDTYTITPQKDINHQNGVTTFDLFLMNKHILGIERLDSPYKQIAADVNDSGTVTAFDMVLLRKVILNIEQDFSGRNTSWRFVPTDYVFQNAADALVEDFPESITVNLQENMALQNFVGIKIGDVNNSAVPDQELQSIDDRSGGIELQLEEQFFNKNEQVTVEFNLAEANDIVALQMALNYDAEVLESIDFATEKYVAFDENTAIASAKNGQINVSSLVSTTSAEATVLKLEFRALQAGRLSDVLHIDEEKMRATTYNATGNEQQIYLQYINDAFVEKTANLLPSFPNP